MNFNILAISLEIISDLDEWYSYMFDNTGVFTNSSFVSENYNRVDAILLTNAVCNHLRWKEFDTINLWTLKENLNILLLNPDRQNSETGKFYASEASLMFGNNTQDFFIYLNELDKYINEKIKDIDDKKFKKLIKYIDYKINLPYIITNFTEYLKSKN